MVDTCIKKSKFPTDVDYSLLSFEKTTKKIITGELNKNVLA